MKAATIAFNSASIAAWSSLAAEILDWPGAWR
jgi:hypothetical protein